MSTGMNFYPWVRVQISTHSLFADGRVIALPDLNPTHCHPYLCIFWWLLWKERNMGRIFENIDRSTQLATLILEEINLQMMV
jgi:hypothetical protein